MTAAADSSGVTSLDTHCKGCKSRLCTAMMQAVHPDAMAHGQV
jgi:hypothetical protein